MTYLHHQRRSRHDLVHLRRLQQNHGVTDTPETWRNITTVAKELAFRKTPVERNPPQPPAPVIVDGPTVDTEGNHAVSILLKVHQGKKFLLASCSAEATVKAQISLPGVKSAKVLFEDRTIQLADGVLTDTFTNYGTHSTVSEQKHKSRRRPWTWWTVDMVDGGKRM